jgi:hypothetical protein
MRTLLPLALTGIALLAACTPMPAPQRPATATTAPPPAAPSGLDRVIGRDARTLQLLFGTPDLDVRESGARKLQFTSAICVLDAYLYPSSAGSEPVVRYIDARRPDGNDFDRASCIAALSRRTEAR